MRFKNIVYLLTATLFFAANNTGLYANELGGNESWKFLSPEQREVLINQSDLMKNGSISDGIKNKTIDNRTIDNRTIDNSEETTTTTTTTNNTTNNCQGKDACEFK